MSFFHGIDLCGSVQIVLRSSEALQGLQIQHIKILKNEFVIISVDRCNKDIKVDLQELKANFEKIAKQLQEETKSNPAQAALFVALLGIMQLLFGLVESLQQQLANKTLSNKRVADENINGKRSEKKKGVDSSDKNRADNLSSKKKTNQKELKIEHRERVIGYKGKELSTEEADKLIGTTFTGDDGKRYRYTRRLNSSVKQEIEIRLIQTQYYKLEYIEVDDEGNEKISTLRQTALSAKTDFLKKTSVSVNMMSHIIYLWIRLKSPLNRVAVSLAEYGIKLSRQQLYKDVGITSFMLQPVYEHIKTYIKEEKNLCIDETYFQCREKLKSKIEEPPPGQSKSKAQKSLSKSMRSYIYGIAGECVCIFNHDICRDYDIPKKILLENGIDINTYVETDGFYRGGFNRDENDEILFQHGWCWIHCKRNFCVLMNYGTKVDDTPIDSFIKCHWEKDIKEGRWFCDEISNAFHILHQLTDKCKKDSSLDIVELKNKELRPIIEEICAEAKRIYPDIKSTKNKEAIRSCSEKFYSAIVYIVNNEDRLKSFLDSPYGLMHSTRIEESFRELDILRNSMMASDTIKGAEHLALIYTLYKTAQLNHIEFETYLRKVISAMTEHMHQIVFEKDARGTITGYKSHCIPSEILDALMPWNMDQAK